jgi:hypothetical protein
MKTKVCDNCNKTKFEQDYNNFKKDNICSNCLTEIKRIYTTKNNSTDNSTDNSNSTTNSKITSIVKSKIVEKPVSKTIK